MNHQLLKGVIVVLGLFFATTSQAGEYVLEYNQFQKLNKKQQTEYLKTLRNAVITFEKEQNKKGMKYNTARVEIRLPSWILDYAEAGGGEPCFYAGNLSKTTDDNRYCTNPGENFACKRAGNKTGIKCNKFIYGLSTSGEEFCAPTNGTASADCNTQSSDRYVGQKRDEEIIKDLLKAGAAGGDLEAEYGRLNKSLEANCKWQRQTTLCADLKMYATNNSQAIAKVIAAAAPPPAPAPPAPGPVAPPARPAPGTTPVTPPVEVAKCDNGSPVLSTEEAENLETQVCQFKLKGKDEYFMVRSNIQKVFVLKATSPDGPWCNTEATEPVKRSTDKKCDIESWEFKAPATISGFESKRLEVRREGPSTNVCKFKVKGKNPDVEDFVPGVDLKEARYQKLMSNGIDKVGEKFLRDADRLFASRFQTSDEAECPGAGTRNLSYALVAMMSDKNCEIQEAQIVTQGGDKKGKGFGVHIRTLADDKDKEGRIQYTGADKTKDNPTINWKATRQNMGVSQWLFGDTGFKGLYSSFKDNGACTEINPRPAFRPPAPPATQTRPAVVGNGSP